MNLKFPGNGLNYVTLNDKPLFYEPILDIGKKVKCKIIKVTPVSVDLEILSIDGITPRISYKGVFRPDGLVMEYDCDKKFKVNDVVFGEVLGLGDRNGVIIENIKKIDN
ncbi:hypothetical protein DMUE_0612 [Dictyocoela muelleri]|nr:hypothetical protein DMUE_0612 [Dictyocoela muelleri]